MLCGLYLHVQAYCLFLGITAILLLGLIWPWVCLRGVSGILKVDQARCREGETVRVRIVLNNWLPFGAWGLRIRGGFAPDPETCLGSLTVVPGWRQTEFALNLTVARRGLYPVRPPSLATGFPFGLWEARRPLDVRGSVLVWPQSFFLESIPEAAAGSRDSVGAMFLNKPGIHGDFLGVRQFQRGDSLKRVHWRQTARYDQLIVCERQAAGSPRIQLVLDACTSSHSSDDRDSSREWAMRIAASVAELAAERNVGIEVITPTAVIPLGSGSAQALRVGDLLARVPGRCDGALGQMLMRPACRGFRDGLQLVVTTDRGLIAATGLALDLPRARFIVLASSAFDQNASNEELARLPVRPWIVCDDPSQVPQQVGRGWKEILCAN